MTREEMRAAARAAVADWPELTEAQRLQLAVALRPDLPVGIEREGPKGRRDAATG